MLLENIGSVSSKESRSSYTARPTISASNNAPLIRCAEESHGSAIELFGDLIEDETCAFCGQPANSNAAQSLREQLIRLRRELGSTKNFRVRTADLAEQYSAQADELRSELSANAAALTGTINRSEELRKIRATAAMQEHVAGRISLYLEATAEASERGRLETQLERLEAQIDDLSRALNNEALQEREEAVLFDVLDRMTKYSRRLKYVYSGSLLNFDLTALTVAVDTPTGWKTLQQIGSTANYLAIHVAAHLGLHDYFISNSRPILRFLMLDQPTQAYYPSDLRSALASDLSDLKDADRDSVSALFRSLADFNGQFAGEFQIIVIDHADLYEPQFQNAVIARWRDGEALVPERWFQHRPPPSSDA